MLFFKCKKVNLIIFTLQVGMGKDHTLYALERGYVKFYKDPMAKRKDRKFVGVVFDKLQPLPTPRDQPRVRRLDWRIDILRQSQREDIYAKV